MKKILVSVMGLLCSCAISAEDAANHFVVQTNKVGAKIADTMYGIFFEDINYGADGGLYAEMVKNRSFEFPQHLLGWKAFGQFEVMDDGPFERCPHYIRLKKAGHADRKTGLENEGFFGIATKAGEDYRFSLWARCPKGGSSVVKVVIADNASMGESQEKAVAEVKVEGQEWKKYSAVLKCGETSDKQVLRLFLLADGDKAVCTTDVEHVSLFPVDTWKGRENGLRKDLAQRLADLKPGVMRFPGGCIVEGTDLGNRYQWKNTVGPVENRPLNENRWQHTFAHRFYADYYQSGGMGFFEFFQLCEDMGCEALPVVSCGLACQFQNPDPDVPGVHAPLDSLDTYIQDVMDLIEFANGDVTTTWGKLRADMGHPTPFNLHYIGIGNEQWDYEDNAVYTDRLKAFLKVLRKAHPEIHYIGSTGPFSDGESFDMLQPKMKELKVDLYDEHYYRPEVWFLDGVNRHRYDNYDRKGPKVFAGEYACHGDGKKFNHFYASLLEAAFMTGLERNADIVTMATYAPLFAHVEGWQWRPDMIWFDNLRSMGTCSYYVQQMYSLYKGTNVLPLTMDGKAVAGDDDQNGLFASSVLDSNTGEIYVKVANVSQQPQSLQITFKGVKKPLSGATKLILTSADDDTDNTLDEPTRIAPVSHPVSVGQNGLSDIVPARSFAVYVVKK